MERVDLGKILIEQKTTIGSPNGNDLPLIGVSNTNGLILSQAPRLKDVSRYKLIKKNWFAYNPMRINVGSIGLADHDDKTGIVSPDYVVFSCSNRIDPEYLLFFLKSNFGLSEISKNTGGSVRERLYFRNLSKIKIALPSIEDQKAILYSLKHKISKINDISQEYERLNLDDIKSLRAQILNEAVQGKLTTQWRKDNLDIEPASELLKRISAEKQQLIKAGKIKKEKPLPPISVDEIPFDLPNGWVWDYLGSSMLKITDGTHHSPINSEDGEYKYVTAKNIKDYGVQLSNITYVTDEVHQDIYQRCNPEYGDLLYIKDGATTGICCINNLNEEFSMLSSVALIKQPKEVVGSYLLSVFRSPFYYELMRKGMTGVAITRVTLTKLKSSVVPLPPLEEQKAIVEKVNTLMVLCDALEQDIEHSQVQIEQMMQSCLQEVFETA